MITLADAARDEPYKSHTGKVWPALHAWCSVGYLVQVTEQDRKSVLANLKRLEVAGLITQVGTDGRTNQVKVFKLNLENGPETGTGAELGTDTEIGTDAESGTGPASYGERSQISVQTVPNLGHGTILKRIEPEDTAASPPAGLPACPQLKLLALFTEKVVEAPKPRRELWAGSKGADAMAARWKWVLQAKRESGSRYATTADEAIEWFGRYFDTVAASDFLTGRAGKFKADLAWLMKAENFIKVVQGNYVNREVPA